MFSANTFTSTFVGYSFAFPGVAAYAASKSGLIGLTHYRRLDHLGTRLRLDVLPKRFGRGVTPWSVAASTIRGAGR